jgi:DNA phosphorothioation-dependent restriction protein DptG
VRLICQDRQLPYESFLTGLCNYGLTPQDDDERVALADALERLGLLARYSDAGEASFVHYA